MLKTAPEVHIELGNHITTHTDIDKAYKKIESGDLSGSFWQSAVTSRMVGYDPDIVVSDSLDGDTFFDPDKEYNEDWLRRHKTLIQYKLPPNLADKLQKDMVLVGGDLSLASGIYHDKQTDSGNILNALRVPALTALMGIGTGGIIQALHRYGIRLNSKAREAIEAGEVIDPGIPREIEPGKITRRSFMLKGATVGLGIGAGASAVPRLIADLPTHSVDFLLEYYDALEPLRPHYEFTHWADGRTALLLQKAIEEATDNDAVVSAVLGFGHTRLARDMLKSETERLYRLRKLAEVTIDRVHKTSDTYSASTLEERLDDLRTSFGNRSRFLATANGIDELTPINMVESDVCMDIFSDVLRGYKPD